MKKSIVLTLAAFLLLCVDHNLRAQEGGYPAPDTTSTGQPAYDPFGPETSPDHTGQGSGGVITPGPYDNVIQTYFTRMNSDYYGVQFMLDSPFQISVGMGWTAYVKNGEGFLFKIRGTGFRQTTYDPIQKEDVPYYLSAFEGSVEYPYKENTFRSYKLRVHWVTEAKGLGMAGLGVVVSKGNLLVAGDRTMDRRLGLEATWIQVAGGYVMPLSPRRGGVNLALCAAVDLLGAKYQSYFSESNEFAGAKIGSAGWVFALGWNTDGFMNLAGYVGGEWSFSTGGLGLPTGKIVFADIGRSSLYFGLQSTGRWFNITAGIQKEWEYLDFQETSDSNRALRYYAGINIYLPR